MLTTTLDGFNAHNLGLVDPWDQTLLQAAQGQALAQTLAYARTHSPWYGQHLAAIDTQKINSLQDLAQLPLMDSQDVIDHGPQMLCVSQSKIKRVMTLHTSGSTGAPKRLYFTDHDLQRTKDFFFQGMGNLVDNSDRVLALLPFDQPDNTGDLLIGSLNAHSIFCAGLWPPISPPDLAAVIIKENFTAVVGLPQHLLSLAEFLPSGQVQTMLLCSDYAPQALRQRIELACGCRTFLHYGTTETGLGGGVECQAHAGCHWRQADLIIEIIDAHSGQVLPEGHLGEMVITTLNREAMPLIRYRTGDTAALATAPCSCGGYTARIVSIAGRQKTYTLAPGLNLTSQLLDDTIFAVPGLWDYRATLDYHKGQQRLSLDFLASPQNQPQSQDLDHALQQIPVLVQALNSGQLILGPLGQVPAFAPSHTIKRTINDQRGA